jgi:hypothetical protein
VTHDAGTADIMTTMDPPFPGSVYVRAVALIGARGFTILEIPVDKMLQTTDVLHITVPELLP